MSTTAREDVVAGIKARYELLRGFMDEKVERLFLAVEATVAGAGGVAAVTRATGVRRKRIHAGMKELCGMGPEPAQGVRRKGAGRKPLTDRYPDLKADLEALVEPTSRGDPMSPLRWTSLGVRGLAKALRGKGYEISRQKVAELLGELGYSLQANKKTREGVDHPDRNDQFGEINAVASSFLARGQPVISVDTKKKEPVGNFKNGGTEWSPKGEPTEVNTHDFAKDKAVPYGVYDVTRNEAWVSVGISADTGEFAVQSIRTWWNEMGSQVYPAAKELLITADCGGSNGYRPRLWKVALQSLADETGMSITVMHYPPGTSKWNKIEHRLFSQITRNWRGRPLESYAAVVSLIGATTTESGLIVRSELDSNRYEKGKKISPREMDELLLVRSDFHGEWNYMILPRTPSNGSIIS